MKQGISSHAPALAISLVALFAALGGTVYAAAKIDGKAIRAKSLPGNRLKLRSIPANRLKPGALSALRQIGTLTGADINELTLGQVPNAARADFAETARSAADAQTALNAVNAVNAQTVNGHAAGCLAGTRAFAGACWQETESESAETAADAAAFCADRGGTLPEALPLAAFAQLPGVQLDAGDEWSGDDDRRVLWTRHFRSSHRLSRGRSGFCDFHSQTQVPLRDPAGHLIRCVPRRRESRSPALYPQTG